MLVGMPSLMIVMLTLDKPQSFNYGVPVYHFDIAVYIKGNPVVLTAGVFHCDAAGSSESESSLVACCGTVYETHPVAANAKSCPLSEVPYLDVAYVKWWLSAAC